MNTQYFIPPKFRTAVLFLLVLGFFMLSSAGAEAKIWTVDNTAGADADTTDMPGAIAKASSGDTIIVMPSNYAYSSFNTSKKLFIYSRGHTNNLLDRDRAAVVGAMGFYGGSEGTVVKGLRCASLTMQANNIYIQNCYVYNSGPNYIYGSNSIIEGCVFAADNGLSYLYFVYTYTSNTIIKNNYFSANRYSGSLSGTSAAFIYQGNSSNLVTNNIFVSLQEGSASINSGGFRFFQYSYAKIYNNILYSNVPNQVPFNEQNAGSVFRNNVTYSAANNPSPLPGFNYNDTLPEFETTFSTSYLPYYRVSNDMRLKSGSIGKNGGTDSTDCGVYGLQYPFTSEGNVQGVAIFQDFEVLNPIVKKGGALRVRLVGVKPKN